MGGIDLSTAHFSAEPLSWWVPMRVLLLVLPFYWLCWWAVAAIAIPALIQATTSAESSLRQARFLSRTVLLLSGAVAAGWAARLCYGSAPETIAATSCMLVPWGVLLDRAERREIDGLARTLLAKSVGACRGLFRQRVVPGTKATSGWFVAHLPWTALMVVVSAIASLGVWASAEYLSGRLHAPLAGKLVGALCVCALTALVAFVVTRRVDRKADLAEVLFAAIGLPLVAVLAMVATFAALGFNGVIAVGLFVGVLAVMGICWLGGDSLGAQVPWAVLMTVVSTVASLGVWGAVKYLSGRLDAPAAGNLVGGLCICALIALVAFVVTRRVDRKADLSDILFAAIGLPLLAVLAMVATFSAVGFNGATAVGSFTGVVLALGLWWLVVRFYGGAKSGSDNSEIYPVVAVTIGVLAGKGVAMAYAAVHPVLSGWWQWLFALFR